MYKKIYKKIKEYDTIFIARHIGPDPDALGASIALKDMIINKYPKKKVYVVGAGAARFKFMGVLDKPVDPVPPNSLLIVVDTPDKKRIDGVVLEDFAYVIKIDHHPFIEKYGHLEWIVDNASSSSELIATLGLKTPFKMTKYAAERLFVGMVADTNRFLIRDTSAYTFEIAHLLMKKHGIHIGRLYEELYMRPLQEIKFQGYVAQNFITTPNGVGYIILSDDILKEYNVDAGSGGNIINNFNYIDELLVWVTITQDVKINKYRINIRSRGPFINKVAEQYHGGGHRFASGVRTESIDDVMDIVKELDQVCLEYNEEKEREKDENK